MTPHHLQWESLPETLPAVEIDLTSPDQPAATMPEPEQTTGIEQSTENPWETASHGSFDAHDIHVKSSDANKIMADKYSTQAQRAARIAHNSLAAFAEMAQIDAEEVPEASWLEDQFYNPAAYLLGHHKSVTVEVITDLINEGLAPIMHGTPVPIAEQYTKLLHYRVEGTLGVLITKLWAADTYHIELPHAYDDIRDAKPDTKLGRLRSY